jgi:hypothetical protein
MVEINENKEILITPIIKKTSYSIDVSLSDLIQGKKVRMKQGFYASQLDALELDLNSDTETDLNSTIDSDIKNFKKDNSNSKK